MYLHTVHKHTYPQTKIHNSLQVVYVNIHMRAVDNFYMHANTDDDTKAEKQFKRNGCIVIS